MAAVEFKLTQNQLSTSVDLGLSVTSVADPNRVVITNANGYLQASTVTYNQLKALVDSTDEFASIHNQDDIIQTASFKIRGTAAIHDVDNVEDVQRFTVYGDNANPDAIGNGTNGVFRIAHGDSDNTSLLPSGSAAVIDFGAFYDTHTWIQARAIDDYSVNKELRLNPNGGDVTVNGEAVVLASSAINPSNIIQDSTHRFATDAEKTKLAGIEPNATANDADANLKNRANHTGTQAATTINEDSTHRFATDAEKTAWNASASETVAGNAEIATQLEVYTGTDDSRIVTPLKLLAKSLYNKKIVVFGSSVALGQGATAGNGWASRMSNKLTSLATGWTTTNKSIGGNNTTDLINRFAADVIPENPDVVMIALSLANEGLVSAASGTAKETVYKGYVNNIYKLVDLCRKAGFKAVVTGTYPGNDYSAEDYGFIKSFNAEMEASNIPFVEFLGAVDDGSGHWRTGMFADALHPNDNGHEAMYRAIPLGLFDRVINSSPRIAEIKPSGGILNINSTGTTLPLIRADFNLLGSFSIGFWVKQNAGSTSSKGLMAFVGGLNTARVRNSSGPISIATTADLILSTVTTEDLKWHYVLVRFSHHTNALKLDVDGVNYGTVTNAEFLNITGITLAGRLDSFSFNCDGYSFKDLYVSRVSVNDSQALQLYNGRIFRGSTEIFTSFEDYNGSYFQNKAGSDVLVRSKLPAATYSTGATFTGSVTGADATVSNQFVTKGQLDGLKTSSTYDPPSMTTLTQTTTTLTVTGAVIGDYVQASFSNSLQGMTLSGYVSSANTVTVVFYNGTAGTIDLASGTLKVRVTPQ